MRRRGVLGLLGGAAVAGPSMAKQAVSSGIEGLSLTGGMGIPIAPYYGGTAQATAQNGSFDPSKWARDELMNFLGKSKEELAQERRDCHIGMLDPDIASMRSLSLQGKIDMQRGRTFERDRARQKNWLEKQLKNAIAHLGN